MCVRISLGPESWSAPNLNFAPHSRNAFLYGCASAHSRHQRAREPLPTLLLFHLGHKVVSRCVHLMLSEFPHCWCCHPSAGHHHLLQAAIACLRMGVPASALVLLILFYTPAKAIAWKHSFIQNQPEAFFPLIY